MTKLLHIIASPREEESRTLQISDVFLKKIKERHPDWMIDTLNLTTEELPKLSMKAVDGKYVLLSGKELYGDLKESWEEIIQHIQRFLSADIILVSTPMWNYSIPYMLKHYIDVIVQPKYMFKYTKSGVEGFAKGKKMIVITSRGGEYVSPEMKAMDFQEPYLRTIFGMAGITDFTFIKAEPMDMGAERGEKILSAAKAAAKELAERT